MKLLVTGAAGGLGSQVCRLAAERGWEVLAGKLDREPPAGRPLPLDVRDAAAVTACLLEHRPDAVIHAAYRQSEEALRESVVGATSNVAVASRRVGARLVHLSTDLVFDGEKGRPYAEEDEPRPASPYGEAKLAAERLAAAAHPGALLVRTSLLVGGPGPQEALALRDDVTFYTDEIRSPLLVADLAAALLELVEGDASGPLHVAGPDPLSRYELARLLAARQGRDPDAVRGGPSPGGPRARNVALDSRRAYALLRAPIRAIGG